MPTVTLDSVTTTDAAPTVAPHKISNVSGENSLTVKWTASALTGLVRAYRVLFNTTDRKGTGGKVLHKLGAVCGLDRCGESTSRPLGMATGVQVTKVISYANLPAAVDGGYPVTVTVRDDGGWA